MQKKIERSDFAKYLQGDLKKQFQERAASAPLISKEMARAFLENLDEIARAHDLLQVIFLDTLTMRIADCAAGGANYLAKFTPDENGCGGNALFTGDFVETAVADLRRALQNVIDRADAAAAVVQNLEKNARAGNAAAADELENLGYDALACLARGAAAEAGAK